MAAVHDPTPRSAVQTVPGYVPGRRAAGAQTAALASNESHFDPLPSVRETVVRSAASLNRYPDSSAFALRERIAEHLDVDPARIAVGPGSVGVLQQLISAFCDVGDEVVFAWRSFEAYPLLVALAGGVPVPVPLTSDERHDLDAMAAVVTDRTRVVLLCTPNNPTGTVIRHAEVAEFLARIRRDVVVVIDEAYVEFDEAGDSVDSLLLLSQHPNVVVLRTFSKAYGLAGMRVGYAVSTVPTADAVRRTALPFGVSGLAQEAAIASLDAVNEMRSRVAYVTQERTRILEALRRGGADPVPSQGNFVWVRVAGKAQRRLVRRFDDAEILVRAFAGDGVRVTLADRETNDRVIDILLDA